MTHDREEGKKGNNVNSAKGLDVAPQRNDGWMLVPIEPTVEMLTAAAENQWHQYSPRGIYAAMLKSAPISSCCEPLGYVDDFGNFEFTLQMWMKEEPNVIWRPVYAEPPKAD